MNTPEAPRADYADLSSKPMQVDPFRLILMLPLQQRDIDEVGDATKAAMAVETAMKQPGSRWTPVEDPLTVLDTDKTDLSDAAYETYLYFHPFVRDFLFAPFNDKRKYLRMWARDASSQLQVILPQGQYGPAVQTLTFKVERCHFASFAPVGVAMLVTELVYVAQGDQQLSLAAVLDTIDFLRRVYPGYFPGYSSDRNSGESNYRFHMGGGRYPMHMKWTDTASKSGTTWAHSPIANEPWVSQPISKGQTVVFQSPAPFGPKSEAYSWVGRKNDFKKAVRDRNSDNKTTIPMDGMWRAVLTPPVCDLFDQIEDDRMPHMAYIGVSNPRDISKGDWVRLAFADYRGDSAAYPYSPKILNDFESHHCYDRWYSQNAGPRGEYGWMQTRYLNVGYGFACVGPSKESYFTQVIQSHFRRQYYYLAFLAHFNKAALLTFSKRLADAGKLKSNEDAYRERTTQVLDDILEFNHRYWFAGVSNQLQAEEMYAYWFKHLGLRALHDDVMQEATASHEYLNTRLTTQQNELITTATKWGLVLAILSLLLAWFGVIVGAMGAGFPFSDPLAIPNKKSWSQMGLWDMLSNWCLWSGNSNQLYPPQAFSTLIVLSGIGIVLLVLLAWLIGKAIELYQSASCKRQKAPSKPA